MNTRLVRYIAPWVVIAAASSALGAPPRYRIEIEPVPAPPRPHVAAGCEATSFSTLPGVRIEFTTTDCRWTLDEARAGLRLDYRVHVDRDIDGIVPAASGACGCGQPHISGLTLTEELQDADHRACVGNAGACLGPVDEPLTLRKGTYPGTFTLDGASAAGTGSYTLTVRAAGRREGREGQTDFQAVGSFTLVIEGQPPAYAERSHPAPQRPYR